MMNVWAGLAILAGWLLLKNQGGVASGTPATGGGATGPLAADPTEASTFVNSLLAGLGFPRSNASQATPNTVTTGVRTTGLTGAQPAVQSGATSVVPTAESAATGAAISAAASQGTKYLTTPPPSPVAQVPPTPPVSSVTQAATTPEPYVPPTPEEVQATQELYQAEIPQPETVEITSPEDIPGTQALSTVEAPAPPAVDAAATATENAEQAGTDMLAQATDQGVQLATEQLTAETSLAVPAGTFAETGGGVLSSVSAVLNTVIGPAGLTVAAAIPVVGIVIGGVVAAVEYLLSNPHKAAQKDVETALLKEYVAYNGNPYAAAQAGDLLGFSRLLPIYWYLLAGGAVDQGNPGSTFREILGDGLDQASQELIDAIIALKGPVFHVIVGMYGELDVTWTDQGRTLFGFPSGTEAAASVPSMASGSGG